MLEECHRLVLPIVVLGLETQVITLLQHGQYTLQEALAAPVFHTRQIPSLVIAQPAGNRPLANRIIGKPMKAECTGQDLLCVEYNHQFVKHVIQSYYCKMPVSLGVCFGFGV